VNEEARLLLSRALVSFANLATFSHRSSYFLMLCVCYPAMFRRSTLPSYDIILLLLLLTLLAP